MRVLLHNFIVFMGLINCSVIGERIVRDSASFHFGVPLNYSYSEPRHRSVRRFRSVPGCPKSIEGYPWAIYGRGSPRCYLVGQTADVCTEEPNFTMHLQLRSRFGRCGCNLDECYPISEKTVSASARYRFCIPYSAAPGTYSSCYEMVHDSVERRCYTMYSKGPCLNDDEWLEHDGQGGVKCAERKCPLGMGWNPHQVNNLFKMNQSLEGHTPECCHRRYLLKTLGENLSAGIRGFKCGEGRIWSPAHQSCRIRFKHSSFRAVG